MVYIARVWNPKKEKEELIVTNKRNGLYGMGMAIELNDEQFKELKRQLKKRGLQANKD
jgi:hypothetical protein